MAFSWLDIVCRQSGRIWQRKWKTECHGFSCFWSLRSSAVQEEASYPSLSSGWIVHLAFSCIEGKKISRREKWSLHLFMQNLWSCDWSDYFSRKITFAYGIFCCNSWEVMDAGLDDLTLWWRFLFGRSHKRYLRSKWGIQIRTKIMIRAGRVNIICSFWRLNAILAFLALHLFFHFSVFSWQINGACYFG